MSIAGGPAYLALDRDPRWLELIGEGMRRYGAHYAGSRVAPYCPPVYDELERRLAGWLGAPAALTVSSGSLAARVTLTGLREAGFEVLAGPLAHAAWRDPGVRRFANVEAWAAAAAGALAAGRRVAVVSDRLCPLRCVAADLAWVADLPARGRLLLVVDDSHGLGVLDEGRSAWAAYRALGARLLVSASLGKAFSVPGAVLVGDFDILRAIRASPAFAGASPASVAHAYALAAGLHLADAQRVRLGRLLAWVDPALRGHAASVAGFPVYCLPKALARHLHAAGQPVGSLRYPHADAPEVARLVLRADAEPAPLLRALAAYSPTEARKAS